MTIIYVDTLFLLNALIDYLLLLAAARLAGEPLRRLRFLIAAILGGVYAVAMFLPGMWFLSKLVWRLVSAVLMLLAAYGGSRRLLRQGIIFLALTCAFGGGVVAIGLLGGRGMSIESGVFYAPLDLKVVLLSAAVCYAVVILVFRRLGQHCASSGELKSVVLTLGERTITLTALIDTGNTLSDPISGLPVMVAQGEHVARLLPRVCRPTAEELNDPAGALFRLGKGEWRSRFRLLPYRAVGVERGLLLALRVDSVKINGVKAGSVLVALSPTPVSDGGGYNALVGAGGCL